MHDLTFELTILIRVIAAVILGFAIGLERELTNKYAGLRTNILVCLGSAVFTILSIYAFPMAVDSSNPQAFGDPARIAAQVLTGIGFIGGGTVLRHGSTISGLTTAATLWVAAAIGMACGSGMLDVAIIATIFSVAVLVLIRTFERQVLSHNIKNTKRLRIVAYCKKENADTLHDYIIDNFGYMHEISRKQSESSDELTEICALVDVYVKKPVHSIYKAFQNIEGIESISIQEDND